MDSCSTVLLTLAQTTMTDEEAAAAAAAAGGIAVMLVAILIALAVGLAIGIVICVLLYKVQSAVPPNHRKIEPAMVWLLLIPLFNLIWNFFVYRRIPDSFQSYFASVGRTDVGDCGRNIGLWYAICAACSIIPCVNYVAGPAALVLLIIFLVKMFDLKSKIGQPSIPPPPPLAPAM